MNPLAVEDYEELLALVSLALDDAPYMSCWGTHPPPGSEYGRLLTLQRKLEQARNDAAEAEYRERLQGEAPRVEHDSGRIHDDA